MATVNLVVPGPPPSPHQQVTLTTIDGRRSFTFPLLARVEIDSQAGRWAEIDRAGRRPVTAFKGSGAAGITLEVVVGGEDLTTSCERQIQDLAWIANSEVPVVVASGQLNRYSQTGTWVITDMSTSDQLHVQGTNDIARARVTLTLRSSLTPEQAEYHQL